MLAATLRGCGSRERDLRRQKSKSRGPDGAPLQPVADVRPIRAGCRAVKDSTLVAWYPFLYAPRAGGAYDSHHRTAGIAGRTRRRGGRLAARGARAAAGEAADHRALTTRAPPPAGRIMTTSTTAVSTQREPELFGQTVVVIGGSAGIGLETARRARAEGASLILTGRNPERLEQAAREVD